MLSAHGAAAPEPGGPAHAGVAPHTGLPSSRAMAGQVVSGSATWQRSSVAGRLRAGTIRSNVGLSLSPCGGQEPLVTNPLCCS